MNMRLRKAAQMAAVALVVGVGAVGYVIPQSALTPASATETAHRSVAMEWNALARIYRERGPQCSRGQLGNEDFVTGYAPAPYLVLCDLDGGRGPRWHYLAPFPAPQVMRTAN